MVHSEFLHVTRHLDLKASHCESPLRPICYICSRSIIPLLDQASHIMSSLSIPPLGGDRNRAGEVYAFTWSFEIISLIFVVGRMYSRAKLTHNVWWDDWCVCFALVSSSS